MAWLRSGVLAMLGVLGLSVHADVTLPPCPKAFLSPGGQWRLVVVPGGSGTFERCRRDEIQLGDGRPRSWSRARGTLEHLDQGRWQSAWQAWLTDESPSDAVVSDDGRVATFSRNRSEDALLVLYDREGHEARKLALTDFLPKPYVYVLPRSVSSIHWGGAHAFSADGEQLILQVMIPTADVEALTPANPPKYVGLALDARTGSVLPRQSAAWAEAQRVASRVLAMRCAEKREEDEVYLGAGGLDALGVCGPTSSPHIAQ
ncbi:hypothetical protein ACG04R_02495 [Roseateles sp. BYS78W]|uniref:Uncharacterized protein n=1 Tax=Pelomonas candidula TaxID=3299025 RepID=A0ABW7H760_9BURK